MTVAVSVMATNAAARKYRMTFHLPHPADRPEVYRALAAAVPLLHTEKEDLTLV